MTKPKRHFVASMTDIFGDWVTQAQAIEFLRGMWRAPKQTFQMLTKRPDIARKHIEYWLQYDMLERMPPNMWIGTSIEDQKRADERIPELLQIPAETHFLSVEPMLERIDFKDQWCADYLATGRPPTEIDWVIFGGESGKGARPCNVEWIRDGVKQCKTAGVKVFVKQLGAAYADEKNGVAGYSAKWPFDLLPHGPTQRLKDPKGGDMAEWPEDLRVREMPL
jgi:protein gp37